MKEINQVAVDASFGIVRDHKRRTLYYDETLKKAFQVNEKNFKWIKLNHLAFFIAFIVFYLVWILIGMRIEHFRTLICFGAAIVVYLGIKIGFQLLFFKDKPEAKVDNQMITTLNDVSTLKEKRGLNRYKIGFLVMFLLLIIVDMIQPNIPQWVKILSYALIFSLLYWAISEEFRLNKLIKSNKNEVQ